jgi:SUKH-4 immunity protein
LPKPPPDIVEDLRRTLANIDPPAVTEPDAWWAIVLEQAADGLL